MSRPKTTRVATEPDGPAARAERARRAIEEPLDVRWAFGEPFVELEVRNPIHRTRYRVVFPEYPSRASALCTCTDFARRGLGTCKHLEAGWAWLQQAGTPAEGAPARPSAPDEPIWNGVDRELERLRARGPERIGDVDAVGALLYGTLTEAREGGEEVGRGSAERAGPTPTSRGRP